LYGRDYNGFSGEWEGRDRMPLTRKGRKVMHAMEKTYGSKKKAKRVFYASKNKGKLKSVDRGRKK